ncbi:MULTISPECIES: hypothetical protein [Thioclava]|uniref:Uncharacterized protein n=1 Tax=Thioclava litoralis TaxID=3076557 RepID=A0ABZ1E640_9RHOB|nr:hypothetical protein RPE78_18185 [Thioclava sp. FTW29]
MDRHAIEALASFPFSGFRTNTAEFLLLELYWPAVLQAALGADLSAQVVPLAEADQDVEHFGTPTLLNVWLPQKGRGLKLLYNDPPEEDVAPESPLFAAVSIRQQPPGWDLPTGGQPAPATDRMEELVLIAATDPQVADAVAEAARRFLIDELPMAEMEAYCTALEAEWAAR